MSGGKKAAIAIGVLLVLAAIGVGIWLAVRKDETTEPPQTGGGGTGGGSESGGGGGGGGGGGYYDNTGGTEGTLTSTPTGAPYLKQGGMDLGAWKAEKSWWEHGLQEYSDQNIMSLSYQGQDAIVLTAKPGQTQAGKSWSSGKVVAPTSITRGTFRTRVAAATGKGAQSVIALYPRTLIVDGATGPASCPNCGYVMIVVAQNSYAFGAFVGNVTNAIESGWARLSMGKLGGKAGLPHDYEIEISTDTISLYIDGVQKKRLFIDDLCSKLGAGNCPFTAGTELVPVYGLRILQNFEPKLPSDASMVIIRNAVVPQAAAASARRVKTRRRKLAGARAARAAKAALTRGMGMGMGRRGMGRAMAARARAMGMGMGMGMGRAGARRVRR